jgi:hypothetical protein
LQDALSRLRVASARSHLPWRMCEANSFSGGGLPGVSDTVVGALWTLDFLLLLARYGCSGVNIETGVNQLGFLSCYSPIRDTGNGTASAGAPYYGMLAFAVARRTCTQMLSVNADLRGINATAFLLGRSGKPRTAVIVNRERTSEAVADLRNVGMKHAIVYRLAAAGANGAGQVTFGGSVVDAAGGWSAGRREENNTGIVTVPPLSAVVACTREAEQG